MSITVVCPKCGRSIKAKKKFVLSTGGVPCLRCKVRIPVSREQVEALAAKDTAPDEAVDSALEAAASVPPSETEAPAPQAEAPAIEAEPIASPPAQEDAPAAEEPLPVLPPALEPPPADEPPAAEMVSAPDYANDDDTETITAAIATDPTPEPVQADAPAAAGGQIVFTCPYCPTSYPVRQNLAGKKIRCKGCARIVKIAADSPAVPGSEPAPPPPPPQPIEDDIPVVYSTGTAPVPLPEPAEPPPPQPPTPPARPVQPPPPVIPASGDADEVITSLKKALADAEERASSAEEMLQKTNLDKFNNEMAAFRKIRDLEAQIRDLTLKLKSQDAGPGTLKRTDVEALLKGLCDELDSNLHQELAARKTLLEDLKRQLHQALK